MLLAGTLRTPAAHLLSPRSSSSSHSHRIFFLNTTAASLRLLHSAAPAAAAKPQATCSRPLAPLLDTEAEGAETNEAVCPAAAEARPLCRGSNGALAAAR